MGYTVISQQWQRPCIYQSRALTEVSQYLGFDIHHHCSYHPQSAGAVERENGKIKSKLAKCCDDTGLSWVKALPLILFHMRTRVRSKHGLSPFEILFGRPPQTGIGPKRHVIPTHRAASGTSADLPTFGMRYRLRAPFPRFRYGLVWTNRLYDKEL